MHFVISPNYSCHLDKELSLRNSPSCDCWMGCLEGNKKKKKKKEGEVEKIFSDMLYIITKCVSNLTFISRTLTFP